MESEDFYKKVDGYYLITRQVTHEFQQSQRTTTEIEFTNIQLLPSNS